MPRIAAEWGVSLSVTTLRRLARRAGYRWKRMRRSLRARRDPTLFAFFARELALLHEAEARGELAVVYADECRFSRQAPVPYAWQRRGQAPVELPAERGRTGGTSVLGLWQAKGPGQPLVSYALAGALSAAVFAAVVEDWSRTLTRPTVLVLDNASIHRATCVQQHLHEWQQRGLRLQFLPAYCPELNQIERLWHRCKHYWLTPADYACEQTLYQRVCYVLQRVGTDYSITFA